VFPSSFDYHAAHSLDEALAAKRQGGDDTRFLAGGQSLIPMMKMRLATPATLVDINGVPGLDTLKRTTVTFASARSSVMPISPAPR
jgi:CO/xanthine dehydrogenase FAD-binding subunit